MRPALLAGTTVAGCLDHLAGAAPVAAAHYPGADGERITARELHDA